MRGPSLEKVKQSKYMVCSTYRKKKGQCTSHQIRNSVVEAILLQQIQAVTAYAREHEGEFIRLVTDSTEQKQLKSRLSELQKEIDSVSGLNDNAGRFLDLVRKYDSITELDAEIIRTFVSKVIVHQSDKSGGHRRQQIDVEFNLIGEVVLPE